MSVRATVVVTLGRPGLAPLVAHIDLTDSPQAGEPGKPDPLLEDALRAAADVLNDRMAGRAR